MLKAFPRMGQEGEAFKVPVAVEDPSCLGLLVCTRVCRCWGRAGTCVNDQGEVVCL